MATTCRRNARSVIQLLNAEAYRFDFLQAVRVLERYRDVDEHVGEGTYPDRETVKFRGNLGFSFPATDIDRMNIPAQPGSQPLMTVNFLGLGGAFGPLPAPISELITTQIREGETAGRDFLDVFNHRLVSLLMRLRRSLHPVLQSKRDPQDSEMALALYALLGLGTRGARHGVQRPAQDRLGKVDRSLPQLTGLLHRRPVTIHTLERAIGYHFGLPVRCKPLRGAWLPLEHTERTVIGIRGRNHRLGESVALGARVWHQEAEIVVEFRPTTIKEATRVLPTGRGYQSLKTLLQYALPDAIDCQVVLIVAPQQVTPLRLGRQEGARLGWTSWLPSRRRNKPGIVTLSADWFRSKPQNRLRRTLSEQFSVAIKSSAESANEAQSYSAHGQEARDPV